STNAGLSWTNGFLPGTTVFASPAGAYPRVSDPTVAYDAKHGVWLISYLGFFSANSSADVLVSRSTDGLTWSNPIVINNDGHFNDKNWTACDSTASSPFYGNCYTEFDDNTQGNLILMSTSHDGGLTWGAGLPTANDAHGLGGQPLVQPNGNVVVPILGLAGGQVVSIIMSFTSSNGGMSWAKTNNIAPADFHPPAGGIRADIPLPSAEMDAAGKVYVVWSDCVFAPGCRANDLVMSTSTDGKKWSRITRIPLEPRGSGVDHFLPGVAVDRSTSGNTAHLAVTYYYYPNASCTVDTCQLYVGVSTSADGGASWTPGTPLAGPMALTWLPSTSQGYMVGDYISTSFSGGLAYPAVAVAHAPLGSVLDEATYTAQGGIAVGGSAIAATDQVSSGSSLVPTSSSITLH
ncbi:MAG: sialidase family protein, partial [Bacteroidota bacterium]